MVLKSDSTNIYLKIQPETEHLGEDEIDAYVLQTFLGGTDDSSIEEHLHCCHICQARLEEAWEFIQALRQTLHNNKNTFSHNSVDHESSVN